MRTPSILATAMLALAWAGSAHAQLRIGRTLQITDRPGIQKCPSISGDIVVWQDDRDGVSDIYGYRLSTGEEFPIAVGGEDKAYPHISGSIVIWTEDGPKMTFKGKDLDTGRYFTVQDQVPSTFGNQVYTISGRMVYYSAEVDYASYPAVYSRDIDTGVRTRISPDDGRFHTDPDARDGTLVWTDGSRTYVQDIATGGRQTLLLASHMAEAAVVAEDRLYYVTTGNVWSYDLILGTTTRVSDISSGHPAADGPLVIWTQYGQYPSPLVQAKDMSTGEVIDVVSIPDGGILHTQQATEIDNMRVAWTMSNASFTDMDIYVTELIPEPVTLALLGVGAIGLLRRRRARKRGLGGLPHAQAPLTLKLTRSRCGSLW